MSSVTVTYHELPPVWTGEEELQGFKITNPATPTYFGDGSETAFQSPGAKSWRNMSEGLPDSSTPTTPCSPLDHPPRTPTWGVGGGPPPLQPMGMHVVSSTYMGHNGNINESQQNSSNDAKQQQDVGSTTGSLATSIASLVASIRPGSSTNASNSNSEELCLVCGDKASGYHYNALTCEGCKGFFRRSITKQARYLCKYGGNCDIDMYMRRKCQACRLGKCFRIGMRPELVIPEEQCRRNRAAKQKRVASDGAPTPAKACDTTKAGSPNQQVTSTESISPNPMMQLSKEHQELVYRLIAHQERTELPLDDDLAKLSAFNSQQSTGANMDFQHLAELTILYVQLISDFTSNLPGFEQIKNVQDTQILMKGSCSEVLMLRTARMYEPKSDCIILGNATVNWHYNRETYHKAGIGTATDAIFDFAKSLSKLKIDPAEFALLTAIAVFSDRPGLADAKHVEEIQEVYTTTLQAYVDVHRPKNRAMFARILMKLTDLRSLSQEHAETLINMKMDIPTKGVEESFGVIDNGIQSNQHLPVAFQPPQLLQSPAQTFIPGYYNGNPQWQAGNTLSPGSRSSYYVSAPVNTMSSVSHESQCKYDIGESNEAVAIVSGQSNMAAYRMPNVRIKVEPLVFHGPPGLVSSMGYQHDLMNGGPVPQSPHLPEISSLRLPPNTPTQSMAPSNLTMLGIGSPVGSNPGTPYSNPPTPASASTSGGAMFWHHESKPTMAELTKTMMTGGGGSTYYSNNQQHNNCVP